MHNSDPAQFRASFLRQQEEIRKDFETMAKLFPGVFDKNGKPLVAVLAFPKLKKEQKHGVFQSHYSKGN